MMKTLRINDYKSYKISDSDIVKRVLSGEKELYEILMRRNNQTLYRVVKGYLVQEMEVQDVMQETYLKAYEKLYQFKHESRFSTWLIRIGINEALAKIKVESRLQPYNPENAEKMEFGYNNMNPEKEMIQKEKTLFLEKSIEKLNPDYRSVYILKEVEGLSIKEIAEIMNLSESNVKVRIHRAKNMIKDDLYGLSKHDGLYEFGTSKCDALVDKVMELI